MLDRHWICAHIPHQGKMCLLDCVTDWNTQSVSCQALSHHSQDNPLRAQGRLGISAGIEYAAQAMAVHGALLAGETSIPRQGYLTSVRSVQFYVDQLDNFTDPLLIWAERLSGDDQVILYRFSISHQMKCLLEGRASVVLDHQTRMKENK